MGGPNERAIEEGDESTLVLQRIGRHRSHMPDIRQDPDNRLTAMCFRGGEFSNATRRVDTPEEAGRPDNTLARLRDRTIANASIA